MSLAGRIADGVLCGILTVVLGASLRGCKDEHKAEAPAAEVRQKDSSLILERKPGPTTPPPHQIPPGAKEERRISIRVQPPRGTVSKTEMVPTAIVQDSLKVAADHFSQPVKMVDSCDCQPMDVDISIVRTLDKSRRVIVSTQTGKILSGIDIPLENPIATQRRPTWMLSAFATIDADGGKAGAALAHRVGPAYIGAGILASPSGKPAALGQISIAW